MLGDAYLRIAFAIGPKAENSLVPSSDLEFLNSRIVWRWVEMSLGVSLSALDNIPIRL
jgi:hypothetical protein